MPGSTQAASQLTYRGLAMMVYGKAHRSLRLPCSKHNGPKQAGEERRIKPAGRSLTIKLFSPALLIVLLLHVATSDLTAQHPVFSHHMAIRFQCTQCRIMLSGEAASRHYLANPNHKLTKLPPLPKPTIQRDMLA